MSPTHQAFTSYSILSVKLLLQEYSRKPGVLTRLYVTLSRNIDILPTSGINIATLRLNPLLFLSSGVRYQPLLNDHKTSMNRLWQELTLIPRADG
jgi:hypothetical protein